MFRHPILYTCCCMALVAFFHTSPVQAQNEIDAFFEELFGKDFKIALRTRSDVEDDRKLALSIYETISKDDESTKPIILPFGFKALQLAGNAEDQSLIRDIHQLMIKTDPKSSARIYAALLPYYEKALGKSRTIGSIHNHRALVRLHLLIARAYWKNQQWSDASTHARQAAQLASKVKLLHHESIKFWSTQLVLQNRNALQLDQKLNKLSKDPEDAKTKKELLELLLIEFNRPTDAAMFAEHAEEESWQSHLPLLLKKEEELTDDQVVALGDWYRNDLVHLGSPFGKAALIRQGMHYYELMLERIGEEENAQSLKVNLALKQLESQLTGLPDIELFLPRKATLLSPINPNIDKDIIRKAKALSRRPTQERLDLVFEWVREMNPGLNVNTYSRLKGNQLEQLNLSWSGDLVRIDPLIGLSPSDRVTLARSGKLKNIIPLQGMKLKSLDLAHCGSLQSLAGIEKMPLVSLSIEHCRRLPGYEELATLRQLKSLNLGHGNFSDLTILRGLKLESLTLRDSKQLKDISLLKEFRTLKKLNISNCPNITDFSVLKELRLEELNVSGNKHFKDLELVKHMPLRVLNIGNTEVANLDPIRGKKLTYLNISRLAGLETFEQVRTMASTLNYLDISHLNHLITDDLTILPKYGLQLHELALGGLTSINTLNGVQSMPIHTIHMRGASNVASLNPLRRLKLRGVNCANMPKLGDKDWAMLKNKQLRWVRTGDRARDRLIVPPRR